MAELNDRERILMRIVDQLSATLLLAPGCRAYYPQDFGDHVHFANYQQPKPGDLVLAKTGRVDRWKIGWYVEKQPDGALIREIGTDALCNYGNESFVPILGMSKVDLLEGEQLAMYRKVQQAFYRGDEYCYRFGGIDFEGDVAVICIREVFGGLGMPSQPFNVRVKFTKRTSVKSILAAMREGGYGTRSFRPEAGEAMSA